MVIKNENISVAVEKIPSLKKDYNKSYLFVKVGISEKVCY